jgi:hypothetical protein
MLNVGVPRNGRLKWLCAARWIPGDGSRLGGDLRGSSVGQGSGRRGRRQVRNGMSTGLLSDGGRGGGGWCVQLHYEESVERT